MTPMLLGAMMALYCGATTDCAPCEGNVEGSVMDFYAVLAQVMELLQREGRVSYRALKVLFSLDDDQLEALKDELIEAKRLAVDERGRVLIWGGETSGPSRHTLALPHPRRCLRSSQTTPSRWLPSPHYLVCP